MSDKTMIRRNFLQTMGKVYEALVMTVPGIVAHQSALKDCETLKIPQFDPLKT
jgi:hypothetical protein